MTDREGIVIIIPALNPTRVLEKLIINLKEKGFVHILCVDDGSKEECRAIFEKIQRDHGIEIIRHAVNLGKGRGIKSAMNYILCLYPEIESVITVDADGQHGLRDIERMAEYDLADKEILLGSRKFTCNIPFRSWFGNRLTRLLFKYLCGLDIKDTQTGLRRYPRSTMEKMLQIPGEAYEYETNCLLKCKELDIAIKEIDIQTIYNIENADSHFDPIKDSVRIYMIVLKYSFVSLLSVLIDYSIFFFLLSVKCDLLVATYGGRIGSGSINFLMNRNVVFKAKNGRIVDQLIKYFCLAFLSATLSAFSVNILANEISMPLGISKVFIEFILFFVNFYIQEIFVFQENEKKAIWKKL